VTDYGRADSDSDSTAIPVYGSAPMRPAESAALADPPAAVLPAAEPAEAERPEVELAEAELPGAGPAEAALPQPGPPQPDSPSPAVDVVEALTAVSTQLSELLRLRARDVDLADRLYAENTRLRTGEFAAAVAPLLTGLIRLHDQMTSLANGDPSSVAGMLRIQLLQILDTAAGLSPFEPQLGERFDSSRQAGVGRAATADRAAEGTVARNIKPGFERADGSVVRVAQVEVYRFESPQQ